MPDLFQAAGALVVDNSPQMKAKSRGAVVQIVMKFPTLCNRHSWVRCTTTAGGDKKSKPATYELAALTP